MIYSKVVAIDGPSGSGKSTLTKKLASKLGVLYVDTGAMYRAIGYILQERGRLPIVEEGLEDFLKSLKIDYAPSSEVLIAIDGKDLSLEIRKPEIGLLASSVSQNNTIRVFLVEFQRQVAKKRVCVMEGRDIGTVVFPDAFCKIYLTASPEIRAQRRLDQLREQGHIHQSLQQVLEEVIERDRRDTERELSPLRKAKDAIELDSSKLSEDQVMQNLIKIVSEVATAKGISL